MKSLGIMGGTFDPIHLGHIHAAEQAQERFKLDEVVFATAYCPPHKSVDELAPADQRALMVELAVKDHPGFTASRIEFRRACYTYAGDTIDEFKELYGSKWEYYFITGLDAVLTIINWDRARTYPGISKFIAVLRPGFDLEKIKFKIPGEFENSIIFLENASLPFSSTAIRERVKRNESIKGMAPDSVREYIERHSIYK